MLNHDSGFLAQGVLYLWPMSLPRQFSMKQFLIASLICVPLLLDAQSKQDSKRRMNDVIAQPSIPASAKPDYKAIGAPMPPLRVVYPKKAVYTGDMLKNDANLIVMMFNPTCEHCEDMTFALEQNIDLFKKSNILLMAAPAMGPYLEFFENGTRINKFPKIKMGLDSAGFIDHTFLYEMLPQINVYDAERKLIKTFNGITTIDSLKPYIR
jgi:hypothetical protein